MAETYCGKSCGECVHKEPMHCAGCKIGPGRTYGGDCELAKCVRAKGHETCETCGLRGNCGNFRNRPYLPEYRRRKQEAEQAKKASLARRIPIFGKWLWLLFWLVIPSTIAGLLGNETRWLDLPVVYLVGQAMQLLCSVAYGLILLKLGTEEEGYRKAGVYTLISGTFVVAMAVVSAFTQSAGWTLVLTVPAVIVELIGEYHEYSTHSAVLADLDAELSEKWTLLWKWFIGLYLAMFGCIILIMVPLLGALCLLAAVIGLLVVSILKLVYLYRTAKLFREYSVTFEGENV